MLIIRNMVPRMLTFTFATLTPAALLVGGALWGGILIAAAVLFLTALTSLLDRLGKSGTIEAPDTSGRGLSIVIALVHFALLPLIVWGLASAHLAPVEKAGLFFGAGLWFGQVSNANAHELIHARSRILHRLGMWAYITLLFGHHTSAHVLVHHRFVATRDDPNTARKGESLYRYVLRAWGGSFVQGFRAEAARLHKIDRPAWRNPYGVYVGGAVICVAAAYWLAGGAGVAAYLALCAYAQTQLLMSDYVQHYGLMRRSDGAGKPAPVTTEHSWNSPHWFSSALMLNATRHSDHHTRPDRPYQALELSQDAPMLPRPLPVMASIALIPPLWRRMMDPRVDRWRNA